MPTPKRDTRLLSLILIGICLVLVVTYMGRLVTKANVDNAIVQKQAAIVAAKENQLALEAELRYVRSDAYVQEEAHDELNLMQPDEEIIVVVTTVPAPVAAPAGVDETTTATEADRQAITCRPATQQGPAAEGASRRSGQQKGVTAENECCTIAEHKQDCDQCRQGPIILAGMHDNPTSIDEGDIG